MSQLFAIDIFVTYFMKFVTFFLTGIAKRGDRASPFTPAVGGGVSVPAGGVEKSRWPVSSSSTFHGREDSVVERGIVLSFYSEHCQMQNIY